MTVNKAEPISLEEEELLCESGALGDTDSVTLSSIISSSLPLTSYTNFISFKKLVTSVQVTNKYSNLQQTNQISVFATIY